MRALITGIGGFVGGHLSALLRQEGFEVWGIDRLPVAAGVANRAVAIELGDVCDPAFTDRIVQAARPTHVFHFAWEFDPSRIGSTDAANRNVLGLTVLLESIGASARHARVMIASSSAVYGATEQRPTDKEAQPKQTTAYPISDGALDRQPIDEDAPLKPINAYGISKVAMETAAASFRGPHGMNIVVTRTFNLLGPGMPSRLFAGSLAAQIVAAERGGPRTIKVGRLDSSRDYIDVRDAARAYLALAMASKPTIDERDAAQVDVALASQPAVDVCDAAPAHLALALASQPTQEPWVFNVCAGAAHSCRELADEMVALASVPVTLDHDASRLQSGDIDYQRGSSARLQRTTGWTPAIAFSTSVRDTLDHARSGAS